MYYVAQSQPDVWRLYVVQRDEARKTMTEPVVVPGDPMGDPIYRGATPQGLSVRVFDKTLYYTQIDALDRRTLWRVVDTEIQVAEKTTEKVADLGLALAEDGDAVSYNGHLFLAGQEAAGCLGVYQTDGNDLTFWPVAEANQAPRLAATESHLYWATDTQLQVGVGPEANSLQTPPLLAGQPWDDFNDLLFFAVDEPNRGPVLWRSDGTTAGTFGLMALTGDPNGVFDLQLQALPTGLCFNTQTDANTTGLWITDGTVDGTRCLKELATTDKDGLRLHQFRRFMGRNLYFLANNQLMRYHGVTQEVDVLVGYDGQGPPEHIATIAPVIDQLMIVTDANEGGQGLWMYGPGN